MTTALGVVASVPLWRGFQLRGAQWQFTEQVRVWPSIGASYAVGIDGLSLLLILLTTVLTFTAVLATVTTRAKEYYVTVLVLEAGMLGVYMALDLLLFCLCWVVAAVAMCVLVGADGGRRRVALRVGLMAVVPAVVILLGMLVLHAQGRALTGASTFDLRAFQQLSLPSAAQRWVFLAFFVGFGASSLSVFRWWTSVTTDARAVAVPVLLGAVFLKMGTYGFLRLSLPLLPDASRELAPAVVALAAIGIVFGAVAAFAQTTWTRVLAYASLSHVCLVILGAFSLTPDGLTGSAVHQINHGVSIAALFFLAGLVAERGAERGKGVVLAEYGGLLNAMPLVAGVWLLMTLSLVGVPKLSGFVGTRLIVDGIWPVSRVWSVVAMTGLGLSGLALLWLFSRTMLGEVRSPPGGVLKDLRLREAVVLVPLIAFAAWIGLRPARLLATVETAVARVVLRVSPQYAPEVAGCLAEPPPPEETGLPAGMVLAAPCVEGTAAPESPPHGLKR